MIRTQISLTEKQQDRLRRAAVRRGVSQSTIIREALDEVLERDGRRAQLRRALKVVGQFRSDSEDGLSGSIDHDTILNEGDEPSW